MKAVLKSAFVLLGVSLLLTGCKSQKEVVEEVATPAEIESDSAPAESFVTEEPVQDTVKERTFFASINRGACYGSCPTYKMVIYSDGFVELEGFRAVELIGSYTTTITKKEMDDFVKKANEIGFMDLEDKYDGMITDIPSTTTAIVINGVKKEVYRRYNYPKRILHFETMFDDLMKNQDWIKVETE
jgi:hypothetical protein